LEFFTSDSTALHRRVVNAVCETLDKFMR
jgi:hypothetical protein